MGSEGNGMTEKRTVRRLAKTIRSETGVPLAHANIIARFVWAWDYWSLKEHDVVGKHCTVSRSSCTCCGMTELTVSGPRGTFYKP